MKDSATLQTCKHFLTVIVYMPFVYSIARIANLGKKVFQMQMISLHLCSVAPTSYLSIHIIYETATYHCFVNLVKPFVSHTRFILTEYNIDAVIQLILIVGFVNISTFHVIAMS